jgi:transcriptional regulator with XRE-family HTH domain
MNALNIRQERIRRGWTQEYIGQQVGVSKVAIHDIETGKQKPSFDILLKLLTLFNVDHKNVSRLFAPAEETQPNSSTGKETVKTGKSHSVAAAELSEITPSVMVTAAEDLQDGKADTEEGRRVLDLSRAVCGAALG